MTEKTENDEIKNCLKNILQAALKWQKVQILYLSIICNFIP
jgi:hypothetical protein